MLQESLDVAQFDREWTDLARRICQSIYVNPETQALKNALVKNGFMSLEEKSKFIDISDQTKYNIIYQEYGKEGTPGYGEFSKKWQKWFQSKGVGSGQDRGQRNSVDHILFGSTPDPEQFLLHFEEEILGSMQEPPEANL